MYATKHDDLKCYTCGNTQEGPEELGWCKNQDDQGNVTTCFDTEQSCAVGQIGKNVLLVGSHCITRLNSEFQM